MQLLDTIQHMDKYSYSLLLCKCFSWSAFKNQFPRAINIKSNVADSHFEFANPIL